MFKKKLVAVGIAVVFTLSSFTTVFASDFNKSFTGTTVKVADNDKNGGKGNGKVKIDKDLQKLYKFIDSKDTLWAQVAIEKLACKGIINGIGNGKFAPNAKVTHLEALAMVFRLTGDNYEAESLNDIVDSLYKGKRVAWGQGYINFAIKNKILLKEELADFNPNTPAKRHEIAKYIIRALDKDNIEEAEKHMNKDLDFKDAKDIPEESVGYVYMVNDMKIMMGDKNNKFNPMVPVTRAEMAVLLDRAENGVELPDTDNRKSGIVFVSADENNNTITVKVKGITNTYSVIDNAPVYKDKAIAEIDDLDKGDVLKLYFNSSKKVIFIEVKGNVGDVDEDAKKISFETVTDNNLPSVIDDKVEDLESKENYKAYKYNDYIYLVATMGEKKTGGYDIDIEKLTRTTGSNGKYTVTSVVYTDEPSSNSFNTQVVNYPKSIVRFKYFSNIEEIVFVDENDKEIEDVEVVVLNEDDVEEVTGTIVKIYEDEIKIEKSKDVFDTFEITDDADITVNGKAADFDDLETGMEVELELVNDEVTEVKAEDADVVELEGVITVVNVEKEEIKVKKSNGTVYTLDISDAEITVNGSEDKKVADLKTGMEVEIEKVNNKVTEVVAKDTEVEVSGEITAILSGHRITFEADYNDDKDYSKTYTIGSDVEIITDEDDDADFDELDVEDDVVLIFINNTLTEIEVE